MKDGLAVTPDEIDAFGRDAEFAAGGESSFGEDFTQAKIELAEFAGGDEMLLGDAEDFFAKRRGKFAGGVSEEYCF